MATKLSGYGFEVNEDHLSGLFKIKRRAQDAGRLGVDLPQLLGGGEKRPPYQHGRVIDAGRDK